MFENIKNGWRLASTTRKLIFKDKHLMLYPVYSGLIVLALTLALFVPVFFTASSVLIIMALILFTVVATFISMYFLMALLISFREYTKSSKRISVREALSRVAPYSLVIFEWAVFYTIIVTILRVIESRLRGITQLLVGSIGSFALSVATLFVVPVILDKKVGPIKAIEESISTIMKNFGSTFGGIVYTDLYSLMFIIPGVLILLAGFAALAISLIAGAIIAIAGLLLLVFGLLLEETTTNIFVFILYEYVNKGKLPKGFTKEMMDKAIKKKNATSSSIVKGGFV